MEWKEVRLGDVCDLIAGFAFKAKDFGEFPTKVIKIGDIKPPFVDYVGQVGVDISNYDINRLSKYTVKYGDYVLAMTGATIGKVGKYISENFSYINQRVLKFSPKQNVDADFINYIICSNIFAKYVVNFVDSESAQPNISAPTISKFAFQIPSEKDDQRRIASILSSLDRKIELNNKINADLEEMAQSIFKKWFVDFEPFKDGKFVDSELGMIPEGWKVSQIADIPHILETGKRPKGGAVEKGIPSVGAEHVKGMCAYDYSKTKYINCEFAAKLKTGKINGYELMIYKDGGKPGYFIPNFSIFGEGYPFENCYLNEHVFKLDFDGNKEFNIFCYFFFKTEQIMSYFNAQGAKAAIPGINKKDVENIYIFSPDNESVIKFGEFAYPLFKQMLKNAIENRTLSLLRDTLLPRLMSGEIEVPE
ncbi:restriction endonuclease subunit S [Segatella copri]|uniref:restriction endonuclease subunit S n=1 Tax=Segatella copri TaxID=165179 RepID=UPI001C4911A5|nr:restriction endonuclease subunit S [Segatella copri]MBW0031810.1 restriction endonuclease subunit S [Segatella copri]